MKITILGSGGCTPIPRPTCQCRICKEARKKGIPYSRSGASIFIKDINAVFDTPEDIKEQLNRENIKEVDNIFYTHWHPDHTLGFRIAEMMNMRWLKNRPIKRIKVYALSEVMDDLLAIKNKFGSYLEYYKKIGLISLVRLKDKNPIVINKIKITPILVKSPDVTSTAFVIESKGKKLIYAPCDVKPLPETDLLRNADILITEAYPNDIENDLLKAEMYSISELVELKQKLGIKKVIVTHIEEEFGKNFDDYREMEKRYENVKFAYDGMKISL